MKAWVFFEKGTQNLTKQHYFPIPHIKNEYDVLIKIIAAGLNPIDALKFTFDISFPAIAGMDGCGIVEKIGPSVDPKEIPPGSLVYFVHGIMDSNGTFADYIVKDARSIAVIPEEVYKGKDINRIATTFGGLAKVCVVAYYDIVIKAGLNIYELANPSPYPMVKSIVITGASGGVGSYCIQFARLYKEMQPVEVQDFIKIIAVTAEEHIEYVKSLGATHTIDWKHQNIREKVMEITDDQGADVYIDNIGDTHKGISCLGYNGIYVSNLPIKEDYDLLTQIQNQINLYRVDIIQALNSDNIDSMQEIKGILEVIVGLVAEGKIFPIHEEVIQFDHIKNALPHVKQKHTVGKVIAVINDI